MAKINPDKGRVLVGRKRIAGCVSRLADEIRKTYAGQEELTILAVLTGSMIFLSDLIRRLPMRLRLELVWMTSFYGRRSQQGPPKFKMEIPPGLGGRHVLVVDDILDSGQTLSLIMMGAASQRPASLRSCVFLAKKRPDLPDRVKPDFLGIEIEDEFVFGYGLDYDNLYRNLPDVMVMKSGRRSGKP
ncbi:MAG: hypoxanthine phosphoribosyltransferase [Planctomycetes bacterium]|nr:hypoxanthine phosphoribosyltransferase [Planctomycetota bacterium]